MLHCFQLKLHCFLCCAEVNLPFLYRALQLHAARREFFESLDGFHRDAPYRQVFRPLEFFGERPPPQLRPVAVGVNRHLPRAAAGAQQALVVRLADLDPVLDLAGQVPLPEIGLVRVGQALAERKMLVRIQRERQQPHHHAFVGLRRMPRHRQRVLGVVVAVHVRDLQTGLADRRFERHGRTLTDAVASVAGDGSPEGGRREAKGKRQEAKGGPSAFPDFRPRSLASWRLGGSHLSWSSFVSFVSTPFTRA